MRLAQVQLSRSLMIWSKNGCLGFLYGGGCLKQGRWNILWSCVRMAVPPQPWKELRAWARRMQLAFKWPQSDWGSHKEQLIVAVRAVLKAGHRAPASLLLGKQSYWLQEIHQQLPHLQEQYLVGTGCSRERLASS